MLSTSKDKSKVGLDVEAGSIAAAEVASDGRRVSQVAIAPLDGGLIKEGEVVDPEALSHALRALFSEHKLSKSVRLGVANQRDAYNHPALPLIEESGGARDRGPLPGTGAPADAARPGCPRPSGRLPLQRRGRQPRNGSGRRGGSARHADDASRSGEGGGTAAGGNRPFGLCADPESGQGSAGARRAGPERSRCCSAGRHVLQSRRRHQPCRRPQLDLRLHPHLAVRRGVDRPAAGRAAHARPRARPPVARPRRPGEADARDRRRPGGGHGDPRDPRGGRFEAGRRASPVT